MSHRLTVKYSGDWAHRLMHHQGKCANLHGHTWHAEVVFEADHNPLFQKSGMAADFGDLKAVVKKIVDDWDHSVVLNSHDPLLPLLRDATASGTLGARRPTRSSLPRST